MRFGPSALCTSLDFMHLSVLNPVHSPCICVVLVVPRDLPTSDFLSHVIMFNIAKL